VIADVLPGHPAGVLSGPNLAREIMSGYAAASVVAMEDETIVCELQQVFKSTLFRVYTNQDVVGCEVGGALKNVIAIAAGMGDGLGVGDNTKAAVITRGLAELTRLGVTMGGQLQTFAGLAGMGDLVATCMSKQSRNRYVGEQLGKGRSIDEICAEMHMVAEGVKTSRVVMELAEKFGVEMPIAREVYRVVHEGSTPAQAYKGLLRVAAGSGRIGLALGSDAGLRARSARAARRSATEFAVLPATPARVERCGSRRRRRPRLVHRALGRCPPCGRDARAR
jgi:glycerol-3-phosphate dehydrogenase (NAD(P)+)